MRQSGWRPYKYIIKTTPQGGLFLEKDEVHRGTERKGWFREERERGPS